MSHRIQTKFALRPRERQMLTRVSRAKDWTFHDTLVESIRHLIATDPELARLRPQPQQPAK